MPNDERKSLLGLAPLDQSAGLTSSSEILVYAGKQGPNKEQKRIIDEYAKETMVIEGVRAKTVIALKQIAEIQVNGVVTFDDAVDNIIALKEQQRGKEHQAYTDEFTTRGIQMLGRHLLSVMEVGATNIGIEVHRTLYPAPEVKERPRSLMEKLFG